MNCIIAESSYCTYVIFLLEFKLESMRGIAILVTCDYRGRQLPATNTDADEMRKTFEQLGYDIHERQNENATESEITNLLKALNKYLIAYGTKAKNPDGSEKVIAFAFSGHGGPDDEEDKDSVSLLTYDQKKLSLKGDIMNHVLGIQRVFEIPKLFFINASRGLQTQTTIRKAAIADEGNYRIDYSTIPGHVACSGWMTELACKLRDEKMLSLQNVVAIVKKSVQEGGGQCESIDCLITGPLYLHPK